MVSAIGNRVLILQGPPEKGAECVSELLPLGDRRLGCFFSDSHHPLAKSLHFLTGPGCPLAGSWDIREGPGTHAN